MDWLGFGVSGVGYIFVILYINWYYYGGDNDRAARWMGVRLMIGCLVWGRNYGSTHGFWGSKMAKMGVISTGWNCLG